MSRDRDLALLLQDAGDFWPREPVERLRLYTRDEGEFFVYGVICPHGQMVARQVLKRELAADPGKTFLVLWGKEAVSGLDCVCGSWCRGVSFSDFISATPNWLVVLSEA